MNVTTDCKVVPFTYQGSQVRTVKINGEPMFVAIDVCQTLGISNSRDAISRLDSDEVFVSEFPTGSGVLRSHQVVTESGLYHLIFRSTKPEAKRFRKWVTSEVLPALRRAGLYELSAPPAHTDRHGQGLLFPVESAELLRARTLMVDVALQARPGSKMAQFIRLVKPFIFSEGGTP